MLFLSTLTSIVTRFSLTGDLKKSEQVLTWLTDDDNRELPGEIEAVNGKLFNRVLNENDFVLAFFCT